MHHEYSDQQLFVGVDPKLSDKDYPSGCALMMQYNGQTFPEQVYIGSADDDGARSGTYKNKTSCDGVLDVVCQKAIFETIQGFDTSDDDADDSDSDSDSDSDKCPRLAQHLNNAFQADKSDCGPRRTFHLPLHERRRGPVAAGRVRHRERKSAGRPMPADASAGIQDVQGRGDADVLLPRPP